MKTHTLTTTVAALLMCWLVLVGCSGSGGADAERLAALEAEVEALREDGAARDQSLREELARLRTAMDSIQALLAMEKGAPLPEPSPESGGESGQAAEGEPPSLNEELDAKAKGFLKKNMDRLMSLTAKLLDRLEQELDKQMEQTRPAPAPEGDQI